MKTRLMIVVLLLSGLQLQAQSMRVGILGLFGTTIVDVKKVIGNELNDWNTYSYAFAIQAPIALESGKFNLVPEIGVQRLYYWEEKYFVYLPDPVPRWRWGTIWTAHLGLNAQKLFGEHWYLQGGGNIRIFLDGTGVVPGIMAGAGYIFAVSGSFRIPIGIRTDIVFGNQTPTSIGLSAGVEFGK
jgi:hypothetical protein